MQHTTHWLAALTLGAGLLVGGCNQGAAAKPAKEQPAKVEQVVGADVHRVTLTEAAFKRLAITTTLVREEQVKGAKRTIIPYNAVLYDPHGATWTYTNPEGRVYVRYPVTVEMIDGDRAILTEGPPADTVVVTVGGAELYGAEFGVGH